MGLKKWIGIFVLLFLVNFFLVSRWGLPHLWLALAFVFTAFLYYLVERQVVALLLSLASLAILGVVFYGHPFFFTGLAFWVLYFLERGIRRKNPIGFLALGGISLGISVYAFIPPSFHPYLSIGAPIAFLFLSLYILFRSAG